MTAVDLSDEVAAGVWRPFFDWVDGHPDAFTSDVFDLAVPFGTLWDRRALEALFDAAVGEVRPDTPDRDALFENPLAIAGRRAE